MLFLSIKICIMKRLFILIIFLGVCSVLFSQTQLSLLDGRQIKLESYVFHYDEVEYINYSFIKSNGKLKKSFADVEDVYSISINGKDSVIYTPYEEGEFSVEQMQQIVYAKQFAQIEYNPWWAYITGFAVGCGSMFIPMDPFTRLLIPIAYTTSMALVKPTNSYIIKRHNYAEGNDMFLYGYKHTGRKKIFKNTVIGAIGGVFVASAIVTTLSLIEGE